MCVCINILHIYVLACVSICLSIYVYTYQHIYYDTKCQCLLNASLYCWNISPSAAVVARAALETRVIFF